MATKAQEMQRLIRQYKFENKTDEVDMREIAQFAAARGWPLPVPQDPLDLLAKKFSEAAREEIRYDKETKRPYRGQLAITQWSGEKQKTTWIDTDQAPRHRMQLAVNRYREQMIGEAVMGTNTVDHWNKVNPEQMALIFDSDLTEDVQWRLRGESPESDDEAA